MYRLLVAITVVIVFTEVFLRLFVISPAASMPDQDLGWTYRPNATILHTSEGYAKNHLNSFGYNDSEPSTDKAKRKILVIGDSFTEALQVPQEKNFTSVAEKLSACFDFVSAGQAGLTIIHYSEVAARFSEKISVNQIVVVLSSSDIMDMAAVNYSLVFDHSDIRITGIEVNGNTLSVYRQFLDPVLARSSLATYLKNRIKQIDSLPNIRDPKTKLSSVLLSDEERYEAERIISFVLQDLRNLASVSVLYIPSFEYEINRHSREIDLSKITSEIIQSVAEKLDVPFMRVDGLADSYRISGVPPNGFANRDIRRGHLNLEGHRVTADSLLSIVDLGCDASP